MQSNSSDEKLRRHLIRNAIITGLILLIPLVGMQLSEEVDWGFFDFIAIGTLLFGSSLIYELLARNISSSTWRVLLGITFVMIVLLIWAEMAVGLIEQIVTGEAWERL